MTSSTCTKFHIWDTSGDERFTNMAPVYVRQCDAVVLLFDGSDRLSFGRIKGWVDKVNDR